MIDYRDYYNTGVLVFCNNNDQPGNHTVVLPNHVFLLMIMGDGILYANSSTLGCVMRVIGVSPSVKEIDNYNIEDLDKCPPREACQEVASGQPCNLPPYIHDKVKSSLPKFSNCEKLNNPNHKNFFHKIVNRYIKFTNAIAAVEVNVFTHPEENPLLYGRPMFCHNMMASLLCIEVGNTLTCGHLRERLTTWNNQTNFTATTIFERPITEADYASTAQHLSTTHSLSNLV